MDKYTATEQAYKNGYDKGCKDTAEKFASLVEFHSISRLDESGYETFTISSLGLREILRERFGVEIKE